MTRTSIAYVSLFSLGILAAPALADEAKEDSVPNFKEETLSGDWGGSRTRLFKNGIDIGITHKSDVLANVSGGIRNGAAWLGHTEATAGLDLEKLLGWNTTTAYFHYHSDLGSKFNEYYVGGFMGVDNIEVATNTGQFFHAWIQKSFFKDSLSILAGLYPIDSEFYVTDTSAVFLAPPYGMSNEIAQTGRNGPPIFPIAALALRAKYTSPDKNFYVMGAVTDGVPGDPDHLHGTHVKLGRGDGTLSIIELGYTPQQERTPTGANQTGVVAEPDLEIQEEYFNKTAAGFWRYTAEFDAFDSSRHHSQGAYVLAERTLLAEKGHPSQGLSGFVRLGVASEDVNPVDWSGSLGLRYRGPIPGRDDDIAGIAVTLNHAGGEFRRLSRSNGDSTTERAETDWEFTYRAQINPWFAMQPNVQYIVNPGMDKTLDNAWVIGFRTEIIF